MAGARVEDTPKNDLPRDVSLDPETVAALRGHRERQLADQRATVVVDMSRHVQGYVFTNEFGDPLHTDTPTALFTKLTARAGLQHMRFHGLRHTHATILLKEGTPVHVVAERLGHEDPSVTMTVYAHVLKKQATDAAEVFARAVAAG